MDLTLQGSCFQQQTLSDGSNNDWQIFNKEGDEVYSLPKEFSMEENFIISKYAKKFELLAYHQGRDDMLKKKNMEFQVMEDKYRDVIQDMRDENDRVTTVLDNLLGASMDDDESEEAKIGIPEHMR